LAAWQDVTAGAGRTLIVEGEAGVGKTRLVERFTELARDDGGQVLEGACLPFLQTVPYAPVLGIVACLSGLGDWLHSGTAGGAGSDPIARTWFFQRVTDALGSLVESAPVTVVVEDLHWADEATLDLLLFVAGQVRSMPVLLVGTRRSDEPDRSSRLPGLLAELMRAGRAARLRLSPLDRTQTAELVGGLLGGSPPPEVLLPVLARAEGNPFFAEELVLAAGGDALPETVQELVLARVGELSPSAQRVLRFAAVAGRRVSHSLLAWAAGVPAEELNTAVRESVAHHLLVTDADGYAFRHALTQECLYHQLLTGERQALHELVAASLTAHPEAAVAAGASAAAELAFHWHAAGRAPEAFHTSLVAARAAEQAHAPAEAYLHYRQALDLWDRVPDVERLAGASREDVLLPAAEAASHAGHDRAAQTLARTLLTRCHPDRDADHYVRGLLALRTYLWRAGDVDAASEVALELARRIPAGPGRLRTSVLVHLASHYHLTGMHLQATRCAEQALADAHTLDAPELVADALCSLGIARAMLGCDDGVALISQSLQLSRQLGHGFGIAAGLICMGVGLARSRRFDEAVTVAESGVSELRRLGLHRSVVPFLVGNLIDMLIACGRWDQAEQVCESDLDDDLEPFPTAGLQLPRALLLLRRGRYEEAVELLDAIWEALGRPQDALVGAQLAITSAELGLWRGDWPGARAAVERGRTLTRDTDQVAWLLVVCGLGARLEADAVDAARLAAVPVDLAAALAAAAEHVAVAEAFLSRIEHTTGCQSATLRLLLDLVRAEHARLTHPTSAERWAAIAGAAGPEPYLVAYARWREAEALLAGRASPARAATALRTAHEIATGLGATPLLDRIADLARRARLRLDVPPAEQAAPAVLAPAARLGLTEREAEVLRLIGRGLSNAEIATTLYISPKTASVHVSNILRKLDVSSRVQAAGIAHSTGLLHTDPPDRDPGRTSSAM